MQICISEKGQKASCDGHTGKVIYTISCKLFNKHSLFRGLSVRVCVYKLRGQKAYHDGHTGIMIDIIHMYSYEANNLCFTKFSLKFLRRPNMRVGNRWEKLGIILNLTRETIYLYILTVRRGWVGRFAVLRKCMTKWPLLRKLAAIRHAG